MPSISPCSSPSALSSPVPIRSFGAIVGPLATQIVPRGHQPLPFPWSQRYIHCHDLGAPLGAAHWSCPWVAHDLPVPFLCFPIGHGLSVRIFPVLTQGAPFTLHDLPGLLRNPIVMGVSFLALLYAGSYFTVYSYIEPFLKRWPISRPKALRGHLSSLVSAASAAVLSFPAFMKRAASPYFTLNWGPFLRSWCSFCRQRPSARLCSFAAWSLA